MRALQHLVGIKPLFTELCDAGGAGRKYEPTEGLLAGNLAAQGIDPASVTAEKRKLLGYHWAYPGVGLAERKGTAFQFVPAH